MEIARLEATGGDAAVIAEKRQLMEQIDAMSEANPMLGLARLPPGASSIPILPAMQVRAIATAAARLKKEGLDPEPEIMIPLVSVLAELAKLRGVAVEPPSPRCAAEEGVELDIPVGTMIELPRAAVTADEIATQADFFSFGTNDLTQTTFGFSRDDVEAEFVPQLPGPAACCRSTPSPPIDPGVAKLVKMGVELGHEGNPDIVLRRMRRARRRPRLRADVPRDAASTYVSCSPYRVPLARLAAAQAALEAK